MSVRALVAVVRVVAVDDGGGGQIHFSILAGIGRQAPPSARPDRRMSHPADLYTSSNSELRGCTRGSGKFGSAKAQLRGTARDVGATAQSWGGQRGTVLRSPRPVGLSSWRTVISGGVDRFNLDERGWPAPRPGSGWGVRVGYRPSAGSGGETVEQDAGGNGQGHGGDGASGGVVGVAELFDGEQGEPRR